VTVDMEGRCTNVRLALCGVGETPVDGSKAAAPLIGRAGADGPIKAAAVAIQAAIEPAGNVHASADYQRHLAGVLAQRAIRTAYQRAANAA
jgi:CO/xanthine dehydrogenase FAD-binding subunit